MHNVKSQERDPRLAAATITQFIAQDLRARLRSGEAAPGALTLHALSAHYGVSLTPVRLALKALIGERVLTKGENGRVEPGPAASGGDPAAGRATRPPEASDLESTLAAEVIASGLRGEADYLREEETAARLGVGRTVLRGVLSRLAGKGLLEHLPRRGWRVRAVDEGDLIAYLKVREALELKALDLARPHLDRAAMKGMLRANRRTPGGPLLDNSIHRHLVEKAGNRYIREFFEGPGAYYTTLFDYAAPEARVVAAMARQHRALLRALIAGDWPLARLTLKSHIRAQLPIVRAVMRRLATERS